MEFFVLIKILSLVLHLFSKMKRANNVVEEFSIYLLFKLSFHSTLVKMKIRRTLLREWYVLPSSPSLLKTSRAMESHRGRWNLQKSETKSVFQINFPTQHYPLKNWGLCFNNLSYFFGIRKPIYLGIFFCATFFPIEWGIY